MKYYKHKINECDCGGVCAPIQTVNDTVGIGNPTPPQMAATTGAEMTDPRCIGSGDKFGSSSEQNKKRKPKFKRKKKVNEGFEDTFDSSLIDYSNDFKDSDRQYRISVIEDFMNKHIGIIFREQKNGEKLLSIKDIYYIDEYFGVHINSKPHAIKIYGKNTWDFWNRTFGNETIDEIPINIVECNCSLTATRLGLKTLKGFPKKVKGRFCVDYNKLTTLEYGPDEVDQEYSARNNKLISLIGAPTIINTVEGKGILRLTENPKIKNNDGLPSDIDYYIEYPMGFYRANKDIHPKNYISDDDIAKIKRELSSYYDSFNINKDHTNIIIDNDKVRIVKSDGFDNYYGLRWHSPWRHSAPCMAGRGKHWSVDDLIREFIKRKEKGTF